MWLRIKPGSTVPVYQQIVSGVKESIAKGALHAGDRLPTVRDTATEFALNHNTVAKAYRALERDGVIVTMGSKGTFIAHIHEVQNRSEKIENLKRSMDTLFIDAHHAGITPEQLKQMFILAVDTWFAAKDPKENLK